ncbi:MAG: flavodoxin [Candidatus Bipolaricaulota bacterium]
MKVGIVVYSQTGNTRGVGQKLREALIAAGHEAVYEDVQLARPREGGSREFKLGPTPQVAGHDLLVFGAAVEAFSLSPVLAQCLRNIDSLDGKRVACLVTQAFPYRWLGGNRALRQMRRLCEAKGARVVAGEVVNWMGAGLEARIERAVRSLVAVLGNRA